MKAARDERALSRLLLALAALAWWWTAARMRGMDHGELLEGRSHARALLFAGGYLAVWGAGGLAAFALATAGRHWTAGGLAWDAAEHWVAGATLLAAALYQPTPLEDACLGRCRRPMAFLLGSWRTGRLGELRTGAANGLWCTGCCWALMASLFALGVRSLAWMALVAALVAAEKSLPWRRTAACSTAAVLLALGVLLLAALHATPRLTIPGRQPMGGLGS